MVSTHLPLCEPEFAVAPSLGDNALVLLERAAHDARCYGNVAVVAVKRVNSCLGGAKVGVERT